MITKVKYLFIAIIAFFVIIVFGELSIVRISQKISNHASISYDFHHETYSKGSDEFSEIVNILTDSAQNNNVALIIQQSDITDGNTETDNYYCINSTEDMLRAEFTKTEYKSLIKGKVIFNFRDISELENINSFSRVFLIGSSGDIANARQHISLVLRESYYEPEKNENIFDYGILIIAAACALLFCFCLSDAIFKRHTNVIRYIYGESRFKIYAGFIIKDSAIIFIIFAAEMWLASLLNEAMSAAVYIALFLVLILFINAMTYLLDLFTNIVAVIKEKGSAKALLSISYGIKWLITLFAVTSICFGINEIEKNVEFFKAKDFYESMDGYSFTNTRVRNEMIYTVDGIKRNAYFEQMINDHYDELSPVLIVTDHYSVADDDPDPDENDPDYVFANYGAKDYIKKAVGKEIKSDRQFVVIIPKEKSGEKERLKEVLENLFLTSEHSLTDKDFEFITAENDIEITAVKDDYGNFFTLKNKPIVFCTQPENKWQVPITQMNIANNRSRYMLRVSDEAKAKLISEYAMLDFGVTDCLSCFMQIWKLRKTTLIYTSGIAVISIITQILIFVFVIGLEFRLERKEFILKKITGYRLYQRYSGVIVTDVFLDGVCFIVSLIIIKYAELPTYSVFIVLALMIIEEAVMFTLNIIKLERTNMLRILKEGVL